MSGLEKKAGDFKVRVGEGGWPVWSEIRWDNGVHDEARFFGLRLGDLKDLHYCISEAIAHVQRVEDVDHARNMAREATR